MSSAQERQDEASSTHVSSLSDQLASTLGSLVAGDAGGILASAGGEATALGLVPGTAAPLTADTQAGTGTVAGTATGAEAGTGAEAAAGGGTPQHSLPGLAQADDVRKQLFPGVVAPEPSQSGGAGISREGTPGTSQPRASITPVPPMNNVSVPQSSGPLATQESPSQAASGVQTGSQSPSELKLLINPARYAAAAKDVSSPSSMAAIGMSPGTRDFAPPFGARFGDRSCEPQRPPHSARAMDAVHEEDDGAGHPGEPSPDSSGPAPASAVSVAGGGPVSSAASLPGTAQPAAADSSGSLPSPGGDGGHAPRVASSTLGVATAATAEAASRPRFRMAFEGRRDEEVLAPVGSSKFAPTPRVKPREGLPWAK